MTIQKLKPIADGIISLLSGNEAIASWRVPLLQPIHVEDGAVIASGALLGGDGRSVGIVNIGGISIAEWPSSKPAGRPKSEEKHLAVFLAWCLCLHKRGEKKSLADDDVASMFNYSEGRKVRAIRNGLAKKLGFNVSEKDIRGFFMITDEDASTTRVDSVVMIGKPTWLSVGDGIEVFGTGYAWHESAGERVIQGVIRVTVGQVERGFDVADAHRGPIIISCIRPG